MNLASSQWMANFIQSGGRKILVRGMIASNSLRRLERPSATKKKERKKEKKAGGESSRHFEPVSVKNDSLRLFYCAKIEKPRREVNLCF